MPWSKQVGCASALQWVSGRSRLPFARSEGDLPLPQPVRTKILAAKPPASGEYQLRSPEPHAVGAIKDQRDDCGRGDRNG